MSSTAGSRDLDDTIGFLQDSQDYVENVMPRSDATAVNKQCPNTDGSTCRSPSLLNPVNRHVPKNNKIDIVRDAEAYADSVSEQLGAVLRTPKSAAVGRKRQLSMPDESVIKKARAEGDRGSGPREPIRAKRLLYKGKQPSTENEESEIKINGQVADKNEKQSKKKQSRGRKGNKTGNSVADEHSIVTTAEIHVDGDIAENCSSTNDLIRKMYTQIQHNFATLNKRFESLETTLEKKLTDKMHKAVDKRISDETVKVKRDLDNRLADIRKEFESDVDELTEKFQSLSNHFESSQQSQNGNRDERNHTKHNIVLCGLPETSGENVSCKVNSLFKDGLKLKDIEVHSAERKRSFNESRPGVVFVKMKSMDDKKKVMTKKASLKDNRRYQNVYIYSDQTREERLMSANFRSLISAYKSGDNNI